MVIKRQCFKKDNQPRITYLSKLNSILMQLFIYLCIAKSSTYNINVELGVNKQAAQKASMAPPLIPALKRRWRSDPHATFSPSSPSTPTSPLLSFSENQ